MGGRSDLRWARTRLELHRRGRSHLKAARHHLRDLVRRELSQVDPDEADPPDFLLLR